MNRRGFWTGLLIGLVIMGLILAVVGMVLFRVRGTALLAGAPGAWREGRLSRGGYYGHMPMFGGGHMFFMPGGLLLIGALVLAFFAGKHWSRHHEHCHRHHEHWHHGEHWRRECCDEHGDEPEAVAEDVPPAAQG